MHHPGILRWILRFHRRSWQIWAPVILNSLAFLPPLFPFSKTLACSLESLLIGNYLHASSIFLGEPQPREQVKSFEVPLSKLQRPWLHQSKDQCIPITQVLMCFSSPHFSAPYNPHALPTSYSQAFVFITLLVYFFCKFTNIYIFQKSILFCFCTSLSLIKWYYKCSFAQLIFLIQIFFLTSISIFVVCSWCLNPAD